MLASYENYDFTKMSEFTADTNNFKLIETREDFLYCVDLLSKESVIGVDLEHNNRISYNGFTCLIQISMYKGEC